LSGPADQGFGLRYLILMLTDRCNLACDYCYNRGLQLGDMTEAAILRIFDIFGPGTEPLHVQLTGGEPTLRPDLLEAAVKAARKLKRRVSVGLQTNGTLIDSPMALRLKKLRLEVGVSLDGLPAVNEITRGGSRALIRGLMALESHKVPFRVTTVVSSANVDHLSQTAVLFGGLAAACGVGLDLLSKAGRPARVGPAAKEQLKKSVFDFARKLREVNLTRGRKLTFRELEMLIKSLNSPRRSQFCRAGAGDSLCVRPDGALFPCGQTARSEALKIGHLNDLSGQQLPNQSIFRSPLTCLTLYSQKCVECVLAGRCPGECPGRLWSNPDGGKLACAMWRGLYEAVKGFPELGLMASGPKDFLEHPGPQSIQPTAAK
jgi:uncharacterized protein